MKIIKNKKIKTKDKKVIFMSNKTTLGVVFPDPSQYSPLLLLSFIPLFYFH